MLSKRLETVASFVSQGARLADIGSDHAYLPIDLVKKGRISRAIAGEVVEGPYQSARQNVQKEALSEQIQVRLASGLAAIEEADAIDEIVIAGMGGRLIVDILNQGKDKLKKIETLILQPNNRESELRVWLGEQAFRIVAEVILEEAGKLYEILVAKPGEMNLTSLEQEFGPFLLQEKSAVFQKKWKKEAVKIQKVLQQIPDSHMKEREKLQQSLLRIKEVLDES